jgi:hypothetical protein
MKLSGCKPLMGSIYCIKMHSFNQWLSISNASAWPILSIGSDKHFLDMLLFILNQVHTMFKFR